MWIWDHLCRDWLIEKGRTPEEELEEDIALMTTDQSADYVISRYGLDLSPKEISDQWEAMAVSRYEQAAPLKDGMADLVLKLWENGTKLAVLTSTFPAACEAVLDHHGLRQYFSGIIYTSETPGDKTMPHIWLYAAKQLGVAPACCVVFEDTYQAIIGVRKAGMNFAAVYDRTCTDWAAMQAEADWVFDA
jgi:HAD superfamily hydrolase (TIGR01509 family)